MRRDGESGVTGLRICFFNRSYWPDLGATGQLLTELAEDLVRDYHCQVSVATGQPLLRVNAARSDAWLWWPVRREVHHGVQIFRAGGTTLRPHQFAARAANYVSYFLSTCLASLVVPRPQVVVALTDPPIIGLTAIFTARRFGAGFTFVCQDVFPQVARLVSDFQNETFNHVLDRINRLLIRQADRVEALGETMHAQLMAEKGADPHKLSVIHNWADCTAIVPKPQFNPFA